MYNNKLFIQFCRERNIKQGTAKCYCSSIENYTSFHDMTIDKLVDEAIIDEENNILLKNRRIKKHLLDYRNYMLDSSLSPNTIKTYFSKLKTFYLHFDIELPSLHDVKFDKYMKQIILDLPNHEHISRALEMVPLSFKALILFISSSGTAKAETLSLTVDDFIKAKQEYHTKTTLNETLDELEERNDIIPTI
ncbi:phage integrase N-terminal SAM-like domain-containing protein [Methanosphaera sp. WGK6]|uniref:phage integrase N-terminal SAM-like domain-containing protein n=1 Tax=Methanosphaera sp. WGK6 TaxID=1561964 RepID=UPI000A4AAAE9|nr:phage integrase N-terminal SAM-like domain-containing protein [Methanosphaera sp. WGK6]